jgi:hypothetical protein
MDYAEHYAILSIKMPEKGANALYRGQRTLPLLYSPSKQVAEISTSIVTRATERNSQIRIETLDKCEIDLTQSPPAVHFFDRKVEQGVYYSISPMLVVARELEPSLSGPHETLRRILEQDAEFMASTTFRQQCARACIILRVLHEPPVPYSMIASLFRVSKGTIYDHYKNFQARQNDCGMIGRPPIMNAEQVIDVIAMITKFYRMGRPLCSKEIRQAIRDRWNISIDADTLYHVLHRHEGVRTVPGIPMDEKRLSVTDEDIRIYFGSLVAQVSGVPSHFLFNMDEMGHQDWADRSEVTCYVPADVIDDRIYYPVSRIGKRITLIACVAADGSYVRPCLVIPRRTFDDELVTTGLTNEKVEIYSQKNSFIDIDIFTDWCRDTLLPDLKRRRKRWNYHGPAFIILDNCSAHSGSEFLEICAEHNLIPIFIPPHSSHQVQPLDLCIFGVTKKLIGRLNRLEKMNVQTAHVAQIVNSFLAAATPSNIVETFRGAGISLVVDLIDDPKDGQRKPYPVCAVTPETCRCVMGAPFGTEDWRTEEISSEEDGTFLPSADEDDQEGDDPNVEEFVRRIRRERRGQS